MKIKFCSMHPSMTVQAAQGLDVNHTDGLSLPERFSTIRLGESQLLSHCSLDFLCDYDVFPKYIMKHECSWKEERRSMRVGDIIIQKAMIPPLGFGLCMEFAVRVREIINEKDRTGFSYETLVGHVESGISEFYIERKAEGLYFTIHTYSEPGHWSSKLFSIFALPYQSWCTQRALNHVKKKFTGNNS